MKFDAKAFIAGLPELPGVYRMLDASGAVLYVGKAKSLKKRVASYFQRTLSSSRIAIMVSRIANIDITVTRSEVEALLLENNLIKHLAPKFNIVFRDDKSYPYIQLTRDDFPRLGFYRGQPDGKADHFGPFPSAVAVRSSLHLLQKVFRLRTCEDSVFAHRSRPCLLHQIHRCSAPCVGKIGHEAYLEDVRLAALFLDGKGQQLVRALAARMEEAAEALAFERAAALRDQIHLLGKLRSPQFISSGASEDVDIVVGVRQAGLLCINLAMVRAGEHLGDKAFFPQHGEQWDVAEALAGFLLQHYGDHPAPAHLLLNQSVASEVVADLALLVGRDLPVARARSEKAKAWVAMAEKNALLAVAARQNTSRAQAEKLEALRDALSLEDLPRRIECFDVSHTQGEATIASCVVFRNGSASRSDYRRFSIRGVAAGDDCAALNQALSRRYKGISEGEGVRPDLIVIDGGAGQVGAAAKALADIGVTDIPLIGLAKGEARKAGLEKIIFPGTDARRKALQLPGDHPGFLLLLEIRDEAHRFAVAGHRARRAIARRESQLEGIRGVGPRRRKQLIAHFGSLAGVRDATVEQLINVPGISPMLAEQVFQALH